MSILLCPEVEARFSEYVDGSLPGTSMVELQEHLRYCRECSASLEAWKTTVETLAQMGRAKAPASLSLRLRVALSHEQERTLSARWEKLKAWWVDHLVPLAVQASAACASLVLMLGTLALLAGTLATPEQAAARDRPIGMATSPRLLYAALPDGRSPLSELNGSLVVRVYVNASGRVYDYRVISGAADPRTRSALANEMMWSVFEPGAGVRRAGAWVAPSFTRRCLGSRVVCCRFIGRLRPDTF